ncbi:MAG: 6,7-dimethyl-8-ribityllumazine synthase [Deltaproteobacteria bacterium]|jgi:6,7-dimethyl-8-ribityllumazine synthase|nr:6,7-dimethyl-8-ribityllumazine synthase [Deltaproteobacteria bacterium]
MTKIVEGQITAKDLKLAIVVSRFNSFITDRLLAGACDAFIRHGGDDKSLTVIKTPGAFELPLVTQTVAKTKKHDAIIALGAIIRGDTPHFDYVASESIKGLAQVTLDSGIPVIYGVLTCDTVEQAIDRAGTKSGNKGFEAAVTAMEMASLLHQIEKSA